MNNLSLLLHTLTVGDGVGSAVVGLAVGVSVGLAFRRKVRESTLSDELLSGETLQKQSK